MLISGAEPPDAAPESDYSGNHEAASVSRAAADSAAAILLSIEALADEREIQPHERPLGKITATHLGQEFVPYASLEEARLDPDAALVIEGDGGGQVYATCPVAMVRCDAETLARLGAALDELGWADPSLAGLFFQRLPIGSPVPAGMGGAEIIDGLWLHPDLEAPDLYEQVLDVLEGKRDGIDPDRADEVLWSGMLRDDWTFGAPLEEHPVSVNAAHAVAIIEGVVQEARPPGLARADSGLIVYGYGWVRAVLAHTAGTLKLDVVAGPGGLRAEVCSGEVEFEDDFDPDGVMFEALLRALCVGRLEARAAAYVDDDEPFWYLRAYEEDGVPMQFGDTLNLDVFEARFGPVTPLPTFNN